MSIVSNKNRLPTSKLADLVIDELSVVDRPCVEPARIVLMKRAVVGAPSTVAVAARKSTHSRTANTVNSKMTTRIAKDAAAARSKIEAALELAGDNAELTAELKAALAELEPPAADDTEKAPTEKEPPVTKFVVLTEAQHAHYAKLHSDDERSAFIAKSDSERSRIVKAAHDADPVVYKCDDGSEIRKSAGDALAAMAKRADEATRTANFEKAAREATELHKRMTSKIGKLGGTDAAKLALLKAAESIVDEALRDEAVQVLVGADALMGEKERPAGVGGESAPVAGGDPMANLEKGLNAFAKANNITTKSPFTDGTLLKFVATTEGAALKRAVDQAAKAKQ